MRNWRLYFSGGALGFIRRSGFLVAALMALGSLAPRMGQSESAPPKALQMDDIKMDWAGGGEEELPTWLSAQLALGPDGKVTGRVVEVGLSDDGNDEDGDPAGFETYVFEVSDGSLKEPQFDGHSFSFTCLYPTDPSWSLAIAGHMDAQGRGWTLDAVSKGRDDDQEGHPKKDGPIRTSAGRNRFPLTSDQKDGVLEIYPKDGEAADGGSTSL
jgi:hypothetical protein